MKLKKLLKEVPVQQVKGSKDIEITGICINSKVVAPGNLFIAKKGRNEDGTKYIPEAISAGAVAVLTDMYDPTLKHVTQLIHPNLNELEGLLAASYYQFPSSELFMVGITGTNGKTTTSFLVKHLLDLEKQSCGLIGTIGYEMGQQRYQTARLTTPDVSSNQKMLREMIVHGCKSAVMEVTSHALTQGRVAFIDYDIGIFTNLTIDHLDYHQNMENYCTAKKKLFDSLTSPVRKRKPYEKHAIINIDSSWAKKMVEDCKAKILTYGLSSSADVYATDIKMDGNSTSFSVIYQGQKIAFHSPLVGRYNVYNVLAATSVLLAKQVPLKIIADYLPLFKSVSGRLESVPNPLGLKIFVDFAHSDDALTNVLECLTELKNKGRIITVFGCGGDRDRSKRPKMAQACEELSDFCIVTSDNPRSEDPAAIIQEIIPGFSKKESYTVKLDRKEAIAQAIAMATAEDIILIAGKGHEPYQIFAHKIVEFDDRKVASQLCQEKWKNK